MTFKQPVYFGDLLTGNVRLVGTSYVVYVAIDDQGRPTCPPALTRTSDEGRRRWREAEECRARRRT